jgi:hypothetical protein
MEKDYYTVMLWTDIEPQLYGPFASAELRDRKTRDLRAEVGCEHGFFRLEVSRGTSVELECYANDEFI